MKRLIILILIVSCLLFLFFCYKQKNYILTGKKAEIKNLTPVSIIWYKFGETGWKRVDEFEPNKADRETIKQLILDANGEGELPWRVDYKLVLFFYDGLPEHFKLKEITFFLEEVSEKGILFQGSIGASYPLGNLLSKYEFIKRYSELHPEMRRIAEESEKAQRAAIKKLKEQEANQP
ncbi:MAG: hypothetical protein WC375_11700 [Methanomassiliicoccales archaeon]|jgi:hypothetical protein